MHPLHYLAIFLVGFAGTLLAFFVRELFRNQAEAPAREIAENDARHAISYGATDPRTPPEGYLLFGNGPLFHLASGVHHRDILIFDEGRWNTGKSNGATRLKLAIRKGSRLAKLNCL